MHQKDTNTIILTRGYSVIKDFRTKGGRGQRRSQLFILGALLGVNKHKTVNTGFHQYCGIFLPHKGHITCGKNIPT